MNTCKFNNVLCSNLTGYSFGSIMPGRNYQSSSGYRYGFNGQEHEDEIAGIGNINTAEFWEYDTRLGRRWNGDPVVKPWESVYVCFGNNPIWFIDPSGRDTTFSDKQAQTDFNKAFDMTKNKIGDANNRISKAKDKLENGNWFQRIGQKNKLSSAEIDLKGLNKILDDFKYIIDPSTPEVIYSTDDSGLKSNEAGKTITSEDSNGEITSAKVFFRSGYFSTVIHENRHTRQPFSMPAYNAELEAHIYQRIFNYSDVQKKIDNHLQNEYLNKGKPIPMNFRLEDYIKEVYK